MTPVLVSHLMPVWKPRPEWLRAAVRGVLDQEGANVELIVVDDGNDEPVAPLLDDIGDPRLRVVRIPHGGASAARNAGLEHARGELIRYADADDYLPPRSTATLVALAAAHPGSIPYGATLFCDEDLRPRWLMTSDIQGDAAEACVLGRFTTRVPAMVFPRAVVEAAGPWDTTLPVSADWDWAVRIYERAPVVGIREPMIWYRKNATSITSNRAAGRETALIVLERYLHRHPDRRGTAFERRARARVDAAEARVALTRRRPRDAAAPLGRALRVSPRAVLDEVAATVGPARQLLARRARGVPLGP